MLLTKNEKKKIGIGELDQHGDRLTNESPSAPWHERKEAFVTVTRHKVKTRRENRPAMKLCSDVACHVAGSYSGIENNGCHLKVTQHKNQRKANKFHVNETKEKSTSPPKLNSVDEPGDPFRDIA